jgi:hypothetical protein
MKTYYTLSRNYEKLKRLLDAGYLLAGYVDYTYHGAEPPHPRDLVNIVVRAETVEFYVRGSGYGSAGTFEERLYGIPADVLFQKVCTALNLEWIDGVAP